MRNYEVCTSRMIAVAVLLLNFLAEGDARAEVQAIAVGQREPFAGGMSFGETGPYEKIVGVVRFAVDPAHLRNRAIVDLGLAPRNALGKVQHFLVREMYQGAVRNSPRPRESGDPESACPLTRA